MRRTEFHCQGDFGWQLTLYYNECSVQPWVLKSWSHSLDLEEQCLSGRSNSSPQAMSHVPMILTIICMLVVLKSYLWHRLGSQTLITTNPNLTDLSPCFPYECLTLRPPPAGKKISGLFSSLHTFTLLVWGHLTHCPGPTLDSRRLSSTWPSWSQRQLLRLSRALDNLVLPFPSLLQVYPHPARATCTSSCLALASSLSALLSVLETFAKGRFKKSRLLFSAENFHWYLIAPEMGLKLLTVHMSHSKARSLPQHIPSPCSGPWPLCWFTMTVQSDTVTVLLWSGLVYDVIEWWTKYEISRAAPV